MPYEKESFGNQAAVQLVEWKRRPLFKREAISNLLFKVSERGSLFLTGDINGQTLSALGAPTSQYFATIFGGHPQAEAMVVLSLTVRRLKRSFHCFSKFILTEPPNIRKAGEPSRGKKKGGGSGLGLARPDRGAQHKVFKSPP